MKIVEEAGLTLPDELSDDLKLKTTAGSKINLPAVVFKKLTQIS